MQADPTAFGPVGDQKEPDCRPVHRVNSFCRGIDEPTLMDIAEITGGTYYSAGSADELQGVFQSLPTYLITKHETTEISFAFTAIGAVVTALAVVLALIWHPLP
jgi:Ca-activated chloride channel family protein